MQIASWNNLLHFSKLRFPPSQFEDPYGALFKLTQTSTARDYQLLFKPLRINYFNLFCGTFSLLMISRFIVVLRKVTYNIWLKFFSCLAKECFYLNHSKCLLLRKPWSTWACDFFLVQQPVPQNLKQPRGFFKTNRLIS